jgi:DNA-binding protein HU-beta
MNRQELIASVADESNLNRADATRAVDAVFTAIEGALKKQMEVRLIGFGTFQVAQRKASRGRNPRTGEEIGIPASTSVRFRAGKTLKDAVN